MKPVTIAIDAMSGDRGADVVASAALDAVKENEALSLVLVGIRSELEALLHPGALANSYRRSCRLSCG